MLPRLKFSFTWYIILSERKRNKYAMHERDYEMKKEWNKPEVKELSIESTECVGWYPPQKPHWPHWPHNPHKPYPGFPGFPGFPGCPGYDDDDDQEKVDRIS